MAQIITSNIAYLGDAAALPPKNAPLPGLASAYFDFQAQLAILRNITTGAVTRYSGAALATLLGYAAPAGTKTYVGSDRLLHVAGANQLRTEYDVSTGDFKGLMCEPNTTNYLPYSADFSQASWTKTGVVPTPAQAGDPFGTATATLLADTTDNTVHSLVDVSSSTPAPFPVGFSVFAKQGTSKILQLSLGGNAAANAYANFDLSSGKVVAQGAGALIATIEVAPNGLYRCYICANQATATTTGIGTISLTNDVAAATPGTAYVGTGKNVLIFGAQVDLSAGRSSYIPTVGASVARAADAYTIAAAAATFVSQGQGTLLINGRYPALLRDQVASTPKEVEYHGAASLYASPSSVIAEALTGSSPAGQWSLNMSTGVVRSGSQNFSAGAQFTEILGYSGAGEVLYDGVSFVTGTTGAPSAAMDFRIGRGREASGTVRPAYFYGHLAKLIYYPSQLTQSQAAAEFY